MNRSRTRWVASLLLLSLATSVAGIAADDLDPAKFANPPIEFRPIDCWWWDGGKITREKLLEQLHDMHAKGVGGTWLYPRFGADQPLSGDPGFWTEGWWDLVRFTLEQQEKLGMKQWANDWLGRLDKAYFQNQIRAERNTNPALIGSRLVTYKKKSVNAEPIRIEVPAKEVILTAAAYRVTGDGDNVDGNSRVDLSPKIQGQTLHWTPTAAGWLAIIVTTQPHDLNYLSPVVAERWIEIFFAKYEKQLGSALGRTLTAYGPDERSVLDGNILYSDGLAKRFQDEKGYDPIAELPALFLDVGAKTDKIRCAYYDVMVSLLEENLYRPLQQWLHEHGMQQVTIATWGRENMLGQTSNYGDFFRLMRNFDIPGNEDSQESGTGAFIDSKLSSSIAHLNGKPRVAVCAYWGTGWGFTQEQNLARTNVNFALGTTLYNTHGVLYSLMGGRNEFVPPEVHFYQPYWKTWRTFTDYVSRLSYVLSQGKHRGDVALIYPLSTVHANWVGGSEFGAAAKLAQSSCFQLAKAIHRDGLDFDFLDEASLARGSSSNGKLTVAELEFSVIVVPAMSTIRLDALRTIQGHVANGGVVIVLGKPPMASVENGRDDALVLSTWQEILGDWEVGDKPIVEHGHASGGKGILVRTVEREVPAVVRQSIVPDVRCADSDLIHTHQKIGERHVYFLTSTRAAAREITVTLAVKGAPSLWDAHSGKITPIHRFELLPDGTKLRVSLGPNEGVLIVLDPKSSAPNIVQDNFKSVDTVRHEGNGFVVEGTRDPEDEVTATVRFDGRTYFGRDPGRPMPAARVPLDGLWECEYRATMDNRWGDYRYPGTNEILGSEAPRFKYRTEVAGQPQAEWQGPDLDEKEWREVQATFGPFWSTIALSTNQDSDDLRDDIVSGAVDGSSPLLQKGTAIAWTLYEYSWKYGLDRVDLQQQGGDGLGPVNPDFLVFEPRGEETTVRYLTTRVFVPVAKETYLHFGSPADRAPRQAWLNGTEVIRVDKDQNVAIAGITLQAGWNRLVLRIEQAPKQSFAMFAAFHPSATTPGQPRYLPISRWYEANGNLAFDPHPETATSTVWYRFQAPPGARSARLPIRAMKVEAWIDGEEAPVNGGVLTFPKDSTVTTVALRVQPEAGFYAGAAFFEPVVFNCWAGQIPLGDWCNFGLRYYSGGVVYRKKFLLSPEQIKSQVLLDLGDVRTSAEVIVNGMPLGVKLARPFVFDISSAVHPGENEINVEVLNTLANFMSNQPTRYVYEGQTVSGLLGPAEIRLAPRVKILCTQAETK